MSMTSREKIIVQYRNFSQLQILTDPGVAAELFETFSFFAPNYKYMPLYRAKRWDGKIRLFNTKTRTFPAGLFHEIEKFASHPNRQYELEVKDHPIYGSPKDKENITPEQFKAWVDDLNLTGSDGNPITPRDYQLHGAYETIRNFRKLVVSPTGSGKSLIMYIVMRWVLETMEPDDKFVIVVPTTTLTKQLFGDFSDYSQSNGFDVKKYCHEIFAGQDRNTDHPVLISTWQSLCKFPKPFFSRIKGIIGDEAHTFNAKVVASVVDNCINARYRCGTTGTLDDALVSELSLEGYFGKKVVVTTTAEQIEAGNLAEIDIHGLRLVYPEEERKLAKFKYDDEINYIIGHEKRNKFIANLTKSLKGNSLVMFRYRTHGDLLYKLITERVPENRKVFLIHGGIDTDYRNEVRAIVEKEKDAIIVASIGTYSTGINIRNLHNLIFASPHKGKIKVIQSIGRTLRISTDGRSTNMYDIIDDLSYKKRQNFALRHGIARLTQYAKEKLPYKIHEVKL